MKFRIHKPRVATRAWLPALSITLAAIAFGVMGGLGTLALGPSDTASASNVEKCSNGKFKRWPNNSATYDRSHGNFAGWWQDEIDAAADIWNDNSGANFSLHDYSASDHEWYKSRRPYDDRPGLTQHTLIDAQRCRIIAMWSLYNTRFSFTDCGNNCDTDNEELDARHVAAHEFAHWFVLDDTGKPWQYSCVSFPKFRTDYTLCNHEKDHVQDIYGED
ncbi:MAG: hypothetical protein OXR67_00630 [Chloroflexota bacterium]|nr:hypothetical protein [Chloroflexota bacterium]